MKVKIIFVCILVFTAGCSKEENTTPGTTPTPAVAVKEAAVQEDERKPLQVLMIDYPPFLDRNAEKHGMSAEIFYEALEGSGFRPVPLFMPPARCEIEFLEGLYPVTLSNNSAFFSVDFLRTVKMQTVYYSFFYDYARQNIQWETLDDLSEYRAVVLRVGKTNAHRDLLAKTGLRVYEVETLDQAFRMLESGRADLVLAVDLSARYELNKLFPDNRSIVPTKKKYRVIEGGPWVNINHPDGPALLDALERGKARMVANGWLDEIHRAYYAPWTYLPIPR